MLYKCYSRLTRSRNLVQLLAWGSFLPSYDPSHYLAALVPHWGCTTKILKSSSNGHFSFDGTARSVPRSKMLKIPCERAAQCGTYSVRIAPTQCAQQIFEKSRSAGRHMSSKAGKGLSWVASLVSWSAVCSCVKGRTHGTCPSATLVWLIPVPMLRKKDLHKAAPKTYDVKTATPVYLKMDSPAVVSWALCSTIKRYAQLVRAVCHRWPWLY